MSHVTCGDPTAVALSVSLPLRPTVSWLLAWGQREDSAHECALAKLRRARAAVPVGHSRLPHDTQAHAY